MVQPTLTSWHREWVDSLPPMITPEGQEFLKEALQHQGHHPIAQPCWTALLGIVFRVMTMLIIGASGFLGGELVRQATASGHAVSGTFARNPGRYSGSKWLPLDLRNRDEIVSVLDEVHPRVVINAASRKTDWATTAEGAIRVAMAAASQGARLVHVSSDAVFSGAQVCYDESATPDPITPYGAAKAAAETAIRLLAPAAVIVRTSLIIGDGDSEHEKFVHELSDGRRNGALFTDDVRCSVHVSDLAAAILELAFSDHAGIRHVAGRDAVSRYELGLLIARRDGLDASTLPAGRRADTGGAPGPLDVRHRRRLQQRRGSAAPHAR